MPIIRFVSTKAINFRVLVVVIHIHWKAGCGSQLRYISLESFRMPCKLNSDYLLRGVLLAMCLVPSLDFTIKKTSPPSPLCHYVALLCCPHTHKNSRLPAVGKAKNRKGPVKWWKAPARPEVGNRKGNGNLHFTALSRIICPFYHRARRLCSQSISPEKGTWKRWK